MIIDLRGKYALVTGAGRGIGKACALWLAKSGASIIINDLPASPDLESTKNKILNEGVSCTLISSSIIPL